MKSVPSVAYMHTQEDAGKNAMTNSGAGQPSTSETLCRPTPNFVTAGSITVSFKPIGTVKEVYDIMQYSVICHYVACQHYAGEEETIAIN